MSPRTLPPGYRELKKTRNRERRGNLLDTLILRRNFLAVGRIASREERPCDIPGDVKPQYIEGNFFFTNVIINTTYSDV